MPDIKTPNRRVTVGATVTQKERDLIRWYAASLGTSIGALLREASVVDLIEIARKRHTERVEAHYSTAEV